jgi:hypothetical protein
MGAKSRGFLSPAEGRIRGAAAYQKNASHADPSSGSATNADAQTSGNDGGARTSTAGGDDHATAQAIISGYHAAQHALESSGSPDAARPHLLHVLNASTGYGKADFEAVSAAADSFDLTLRSRSHGKPHELDDLNKSARQGLGLGPTHNPRQNMSGGNAASYAKAAIGPALDTLAARTRASLGWLEELESSDQSRRIRTIELIAGDIDFTSEYVKGLLAQIAPEERHSFADATSHAAQAILKIMHWVRERPTHARLSAKLRPGVAKFDEMSAEVGGEKIGDRNEEPLSENQMSHAREEQADFKSALGEAVAAIQFVAKQHKANIKMFGQIAMLDDLPQPDFKAALMTAIIDTALSMLIGHFAKVLFAANVAPAVTGSVGLPAAAGAVSLPAPAAKGHDVLSNIFVIGLGSVKSAVKSEMGKPPGGEVDPLKLGATYFCRALTVAEDARERAYEDNLRKLEANGTVTATELRDITHSMNQQAQGLGDEYLRAITNAWATYLAQSHLGTKHSAGKRVADMDHYFGEKSAGGRVFGTSKAGGTGVLHVLMTIDEGGARPHVDRSATKVIGFNSEQKGHVLESADYELDRVDLPKEVHVHAGFARATIALDEHNNVRDVLNWEQMQRHVGDVTAYRFWQLWGKNVKV